MMAKGRITKEQLSDNLMSYIIENAGGSSIVFKKNTVKTQSGSSRIAIGIEGFVKSVDLLMVFKNSVYLEENEDYIISADGLYIEKTEGMWNESGTSSFNFIVIKGKTSTGTGGGSTGGGGGSIGSGTIEDGSITENMLSDELKTKINPPKTWDWFKGL